MKSKRKIKKIIVHCSDSNWGDVKVIDQWHKERGFDKIGYHFVILNGYRTYPDWKEKRYDPNVDGLIEKGRDIDEVGSHCVGHNKDSIGVCLVGVDKFSEKQFQSLRKLISELIKDLNLTLNDVYPHNYFNKEKSCPNFDLKIIKEQKDGK